MKGLERYIEKHGNHFTEKLAHTVTNSKWDFEQINKVAQSRVYYNVTGTTSGDIIYLVDMVCNRPYNKQPLNRGIKEVLMWVQDYKKRGSAFCIWLAVTAFKEENFDFTPYI